jgi:hypothetical protein
MPKVSMLSVPFTLKRLEGLWNIFKRGIVGSFHKVSRKYTRRGDSCLCVPKTLSGLMP